MDADLHYAEALFSEPPAELGSPTSPKDAGQLEQEDIYRGDPPSPPRSPAPRLPSVSSALSSSSGWSGLGLRRGALGAVLELAINRWARASSGFSDVSSTASSTSVHTHVPRRRRRRSSNATTLNLHSEYVIRARRKARDEFCTLQREFVLFLPPALLPSPALLQETLLFDNCRTLRTPSLPLVLSKLDSAIKRSARLRRPKQPGTTSPARGLEPWFNGYMQSEPSSIGSQGETLRRDKGKSREEPRMPVLSRGQVRAGFEQPQRQQAWWLDISSPTWSDMREIGKILHLHPLTLEDILHQDPREKLELFPRLGYYFIVFRALESEHTRSNARVGIDKKVADHTVPFNDSTIFGTNVYIAVFRDGICSFHFEDIADHVGHVRNKILQLEETINVSSDWIAHGILDSIVDDYFPKLNSIEREIKDFDDQLLSDVQPTRKPTSQSQPSLELNGDLSEKTTTEIALEDKENKTEFSASERMPMLGRRFGGRILSQFAVFLRQLSALFPAPKLWRWIHFSKRPSHVPSSPSPLMRMASTRRLVISLTRLLGTKSEVVSQIRKRLTNGVSVGPKSGPIEHALSVEVGIYFGDIQDHILTLQHSLAHYERMLSHSHPAYLSHLRVSLSQAKGGMDKALLTLSVISVSVMAMQLVTGIFSTNLGRIPRNSRPDPQNPHPPAPFNVFGAVLAGVILTGIGIVFLARYWWLHAKRKYARRPKF